MAGVFLSTGSCISELAAWDYGVFWRMGWDCGGAANRDGEQTKEKRPKLAVFTRPADNRPRLSVGDTTGGLVPQAVTFSRAGICVKQWR